MNSPAVEATAKAAPQFQTLQLDLLHADPAQPRKYFNPEAIEQLGQSIKETGLIQPIVVRPNGKGYSIIAGERRLRAAKAAGLKELATIVRTDLNDQDVEVLHVLENLQRENLTTFELCTGVGKLVKTLGFEATCKRLGKSAAWVSKHSRLDTLHESVRRLIEDRKLDDIESAQNLSALLTLDKAAAEEFIKRLTLVPKPGKEIEPWEQPPTREEIRLRARVAKDKHDRKEKERTVKAAAKKDPKAMKQIAREKNEQIKESELKQRAAELNTASETEEVRLMEALYQILRQPIPKKKPTHGGQSRYDYDLPVTLNPPGFRVDRWSKPNLPSSVEGVQFSVQVNSDLAVAQRIAQIFGVKPKVRVEMPYELDLDIAEKVGAALRGVKGVSFEFSIAKSVRELRSALKCPAPAAAAAAKTAALVTAVKHAPPAKKAAPAKPAKKVKK